MHKKLYYNTLGFGWVAQWWSGRFISDRLSVRSRPQLLRPVGLPRINATVRQGRRRGDTESFVRGSIPTPGTDLTKPNCFPKLISNFMETLVGGTVSFIIFHLISHPTSRITKKIPQAKIKKIQILPNLRIEVKNRVFHVHHWMWIAPFYVAAQIIDKGILKSDLVHGALLGGFLQGLLFRDSLKFIHPATEAFKHQGYTQYPLYFIRKLI